LFHATFITHDFSIGEQVGIRDPETEIVNITYPELMFPGSTSSSTPRDPSSSNSSTSAIVTIIQDYANRSPQKHTPLAFEPAFPKRCRVDTPCSPNTSSCDTVNIQNDAQPLPQNNTPSALAPSTPKRRRVDTPQSASARKAGRTLPKMTGPVWSSRDRSCTYYCVFMIMLNLYSTVSLDVRDKLRNRSELMEMLFASFTVL